MLTGRRREDREEREREELDFRIALPPFLGIGNWARAAQLVKKHSDSL